MLAWHNAHLASEALPFSYDEKSRQKISRCRKISTILVAGLAHL